MKTITLVYIANATLLLLHEIESAYEKEWQLLKLPGGITGFLLFHVPIIFIMLYASVEIDKGTVVGLLLGVLVGIGGILPFIVHKLMLKTPSQFNRPISNAVIYLNILSGVWLVYLSLRSLAE